MMPLKIDRYIIPIMNKKNNNPNKNKKKSNSNS